MAALFDVRPEERRGVTLAFLALLGITASHTLLETARDALFLAKIPVSHLPALYLAIAAAGLVTTRLGAAFEARRARAPRAGGVRRGRLRLDPVAASLAGAAVVTAAFWVATGSSSPLVLYALYVYSGMFASWVAGRLWIRLGTIFTVVQAKRLYGLVGTGAVLGAVVGAGAARASLAVLEVRHLLLVGAGLLVVTALGPASMLPSPEPDAATRARDRDPAADAAPTLRAAVRAVLGHPYLVRILGVVMLTAVVGTAVDFLFKREVALAITDRQQLGTFLATVSLATNGASLIAQAIGVGVAMRVLGVHRALYVMPLMLGLGAIGAVLGLGLAAALALRGIDGTLRHSLQKTSTELLFVPLPDALRARAKPIVDLVGQRGGQAVASLALLGVAALAGDGVGVAAGAGIVALSVAWLLLARSVRPRYLDVFRATLRRGREELPSELPALDMSALEQLIAALSSKKDPEVIGALDLLAVQARGRLLPSLVLFHPSKPVVLRSLEILVQEGRTDFVPVADRLLAHLDPEIRAAALRARAAVDPDPAFLGELLQSEADELRATALVALVATGNMTGDSAAAKLAEHASGRVEVRRALASAIGEAHGSPAGPGRVLLERTLFALVADADAETRSAAALAMGRLGSPGFAPTLLELLVDRSAGLAAIEALGAMGDAAIEFVDRALDRTDIEQAIRWRLVRAMARSTAPSALQRMARRAVETQDTGLRSRLLRALRALQTAGTKVPITRAELVALAEASVAAVGRALALRLAFERLLAERGAPASAGAELLQQLLRDKEVEGADRLFLTLALMHPAERFARIQRGLESPSAKARASARELIENVVRPPLRDQVLALVDDVPDAVRLGRIGVERTEATYEELLRAMIEQGGELGALAAYHAQEAGLGESVKVAIAAMEQSSLALARELSVYDRDEVIRSGEVRL